MSVASENRTKWEAVVSQYMKLSRAMQRSKFHESELISKCRELKTTLVEKAQQLQVAQAQRIEDEATMQTLRNEMEKAVARADLSSVRELAARNLVIDLQKEVENLKTRLRSEAIKTAPPAPTQSEEHPAMASQKPRLPVMAEQPNPFEVRLCMAYLSLSHPRARLNGSHVPLFSPRTIRRSGRGQRTSPWGGKVSH
jgi:hypothetical protein